MHTDHLIPKKPEPARDYTAVIYIALWLVPWAMGMAAFSLINVPKPKITVGSAEKYFDFGREKTWTIRSAFGQVVPSVNPIPYSDLMTASGIILRVGDPPTLVDAPMPRRRPKLQIAAPLLLRGLD